MKVLMAAAQPPLPEGNAPGRCAVALLRGLQARGVDVQVVAASRGRRDHAGPSVPSDLKVSTVDFEETPVRWRQWLSKVRRPRGELGRGPFEQRVRQAAPGMDVLHLEETETGWCGQGLAVPRVLNVHYLARFDVDWRRVRPRQLPRVAEFVYGETLLARRHDRIVASSDYVADGLRSVSAKSRIEVIPLCLDTDLYQTADAGGSPVVGFIGTMTWGPTRSAVLHLVHRVWPLVHRAVPDAQLWLAGRGMEALGSATRVAGVRTLGEVGSANQFLRSVTLLAYPLSRGSGMKVKVLEAMATGVPVVTTERGAEGVGESAGVVSRQGDLAITRAVVDLLSDPSAAGQRGAAGRRDVETRFSPAATGGAFNEVYDAAVLGH